MSDFSEDETEYDPFDPDNIGAINFTVLFRIYDVLMALLTEKNPGAAAELMSMHSDGLLMGPAPSLLGKFVADIMNEEQTPTDNIPPEEQK